MGWHAAGRLLMVVLATMMALPVVGPGQTLAAAAPCSVTGSGIATTNLQRAINLASPGATLKIGGTCVGDFTIGKSITVQRRAGATSAVLKAKVSRTLRITGGTVGLTGLRITGGRAPNCPSWEGYVCGGGLYIDPTAKVTLTRVTVDNNLAAGGPKDVSSYGAGIYSGGSLTLIGSTVRDNRSTAENWRADAAGIASDGPLVIRQSIVTGNLAITTGNQAWGAGVYEYQGHVLITDSTIQGNVTRGAAIAGGGGLYSHDGSFTIRRSLISANRVEVASGRAATGGALAGNGKVDIANSTIAGNKADTGGAIRFSGMVILDSSTIARNSAPDDGGAVWMLEGQLTIGSTILALNQTNGSGRDCLISDGVEVVDRGWNLLGSGDSCLGVLDGSNGNQVGNDADPLNPGLGLLASNGGPTRTMALLAGSKAINAAGSAPCRASTDQRGVRRPQGAACDIGAFERR